MKNTVFLNSAKVDFDNKLDFAPLKAISNLTNYPSSSPEEILERIKGQHIVISKEVPLGRDLLSQFPPTVSLICEAGTGYNNIDLATAREKNITICNIPGYSSDAVAQLAVAFMLTLSSSLTVQQTMLKQENYANFTKHLQVPHFELLGKTLGVIGAGAIGRQVIRVAQALGMNILVYTRTPKPWGTTSIEFVELDSLLRKSDFISLHCPLTAETKHLIDRDRLNLMKPSAFLINTSRGALIKEVDLIAHLQAGKLAGAGLDVQDPEPPSHDNPLYAMDNVILTPHIGWKPLETRQRLLGIIAANIGAFIRGEPINVVSE